MIKWAVATTVKAPLFEVVKFVSHHLDMGANFFVLFLDAPNPEVQEFFQDDFDVLVVETDYDYWGNADGRPTTIEGRQIYNINHAISLIPAIRPSISWLAHIDIDEFIVNHAAKLTISQKLKRVPQDVTALQIKPIENLLPPQGTPLGPDLFKALMYPWGRRARLSPTIFPEFGDQFIGGFLSHKGGKSIFRIDQGPIYARIHFTSPSMRDRRVPEDTQFLRGYELAHYHTKPWDEFEKLYAERRKSGSYRKLRDDKLMKRVTNRPMWENFDEIEEREGIEGIRRLHQELCIASPELIEKLENFHLLRRFDMRFEAKIAQYFPDFNMPQARAANAD